MLKLRELEHQEKERALGEMNLGSVYEKNCGFIRLRERRNQE